MFARVALAVSDRVAAAVDTDDIAAVVLESSTVPRLALWLDPAAQLTFQLWSPA